MSICLCSKERIRYEIPHHDSTRRRRYLCRGMPDAAGLRFEGRTRAEAIRNIQDAISGYLASLRKHDEPIPPSVTEELVEVAI